jgi:hypothetical protein
VVDWTYGQSEDLAMRRLPNDIPIDTPVKKEKFVYINEYYQEPIGQLSELLGFHVATWSSYEKAFRARGNAGRVGIKYKITIEEVEDEEAPYHYLWSGSV